ncbi:MAG: TetR family transcriptional regulator C-terminal domain-containing protein [Pseudomonadota bacterium]
MTDRLQQAEHTRERILEGAAQEMYRVGYQAASTGNILKRLGISKGALYHHFPSKQALGYAVLDEYLAARHARHWDHVSQTGDPLGAVIDQLATQCQSMRAEQMRHGCPINNLAQEMSPLDEGFRERVSAIYACWQQSLERAFERAQALGTMAPTTDARGLATLIVATTQGAVGLMKNSMDESLFRQAITALLVHLRAQRIQR